MKKIIVCLLAFSCVFSAAFSFSWSGIVDDNTKFSANHDFSRIDLNQGNGIYLSFNSRLGEKENLRIAGEGLYKYSLTCDFKNKKATWQNIVDIDLLKMSGEWTINKGLLSAEAGRFKFSDFSGVVFSQISDGAYASYNTLKTKASCYVGYTGLLNRLNVSMTENEFKKKEQFYELCPKYIPVMADFSYKALFEKHTVGIQLAGYLPLEEKNKAKLYSTVIMNGFFGTIASYDARITLGSEKFDGLMLDAKFDTNFYLPSKIVAAAGAEYISGKKGDIKPFVTLTTRSIGNSPFYNGVFVPKVGAAYVSGKFFGSITERILVDMSGDSAKLDGFDTAVNAVYNLFSDVQLSGDLGIYICKEKKEMNKYYLTLKASLAF